MSLSSIKKCDQVKSPTRNVPHEEFVDQILLGQSKLTVGTWGKCSWKQRTVVVKDTSEILGSLSVLSLVGILKPRKDRRLSQDQKAGSRRLPTL